MKSGFTIVRAIHIVLLTFVFPVAAFAQDGMSLSTSNFVGLDSDNGSGKIVGYCQGKRAVFARSYVSIWVERISLTKKDSLITRLVNSNRNAFSSGKLEATINGQELAVSKIGKPVSVIGSTSRIDLPAQWRLIESAPYVFKDAKVELRISQGSDASIDVLADALNEITTSAPGITISAGVTTGLSLAKAIDKLLFSSERSTAILRAEKDLPISAGLLCDGYYAVYSAADRTAYQKYAIGNVRWDGRDLSYNNSSIDDVSYAVLRVQVFDRYYQRPEDAFNDTNRPWTRKYQDSLSSLAQLAWLNTPEEISEAERRISQSLSEARTLLMADNDLVLEEKSEIISSASNEAKKQIDAVRGRLAAAAKPSGDPANVSFIGRAISVNPALIAPNVREEAARIVKDPTSFNLDLNSSSAKQLRGSIQRLESSALLP